MSRSGVFVLACLVVVLALIVVGMRHAATIEHWLLALHGRH